MSARARVHKCQSLLRTGSRSESRAVSRDGGAGDEETAPELRQSQRRRSWVSETVPSWNENRSRSSSRLNLCPCSRSCPSVSCEAHGTEVRALTTVLLRPCLLSCRWKIFSADTLSPALREKEREVCGCVDKTLAVYPPSCRFWASMREERRRERTSTRAAAAMDVQEQAVNCDGLLLSLPPDASHCLLVRGRIPAHSDEQRSRSLRQPIRDATSPGRRESSDWLRPDSARHLQLSPKEAITL